MWKRTEKVKRSITADKRKWMENIADEAERSCKEPALKKHFKGSQKCRTMKVLDRGQRFQTRM